MIKDQFTFLSSNGKTNIHSIICLPEDSKFIGVIQIIHGMYEYIERYLPFI
jgi:alpha-beta hydrolase superfamily lysophospholipase